MRVRRSSARVVAHLSPVELGSIDLLVQEGFYRTRASFLSSAVAASLRQSEATVIRAAARRGFSLGRVVVDGTCEPVVRVIGVAVVEEAAVDRLEEIVVYGSVEAAPAVIEALGPRLRTRAAVDRRSWNDD